MTMGKQARDYDEKNRSFLKALIVGQVGTELDQSA